MILVSMTAEALRAGPYRPAILAISISEADIQSVLSGLTHILLELFELPLIHHFAAIGISDDATILLKCDKVT